MNITQIAIIVVIAISLIFDITVTIKKGGSESVSWQIWLWAKMYPIIPFLFGVIMGHWFWVQDCYCSGVH